MGRWPTAGNLLRPSCGGGAGHRSQASATGRWAIVHLGEAFGLDLVAEGVENQQDMAELVRLGCQRAQGFLLARPMPPADLDPLLWRGGIDLNRLANAI